MAEEEQLVIEHQLEHAISSRFQYFEDQADSLTMESVRRLLEEDLGLDKFALDVHKGLIRQYMEKNMDGDGKSKEDSENVGKEARSSKEETEASPKQLKTKKNQKRSSTKDEMEDSPIMCVLTTKSELGLPESSVSESLIEKAMWERADYFHENSEKITMAGVRRLVEEDLGLEKFTLDSFKKFISRQIDQVLSSPKEPISVKDKKITSKNLKGKKSEKVVRKDGSGSSDSGGVEADTKLKKRKEPAPRENIKKSEQLNKRKKSEESDLNVSSEKPNKCAKRPKDAGDDYGQEGNTSEGGQSQASGGKPAQHFDGQTKEKSTPAFSKKVENIKSIIKACGMSIPPSMYKKAKQVPDREREGFLVKELEGILLREGLSRNPTEKEIKDCKRRKETARELEGIDTSNIISSARRRSTFSFAVPPQLARPKKNKHDGKDRKLKNNVDEDHDNDNEEDKEEEEGKKKGKDDGSKEDENGVKGVEDEEEEDEEQEEEEEEEDEEEEDEEDEVNEESDEDDNESD